MSVDSLLVCLYFLVFVESKSKEDRIWDYWKLVEIDWLLISCFSVIWLLSACSWYLVDYLFSVSVICSVHYGSW